MNIKELQERTLASNLDLVKNNLVISTWGNVSMYDEETGYVAIKASGVAYAEMQSKHMTVLDLEGNIIAGDYVPSTDTPTHLVIYRAFKDKGVRGVVHTHSQFATMWAQSGRNIPCYGTTHGDYFYGDIPTSRMMTPEEIWGSYEKTTGDVIVETMKGRDCSQTSAVLVHSHGPFVWGNSPEEAVTHSLVLEYIAKMAFCDELLMGGQCATIQKDLADKHYNRKFGPGAYYGQSHK